MAATATASEQATGNAGTLTATASANTIAVSGKVTALYVYVTGTAAATFGYTDSSMVTLPNQTWVEVWSRSTRGGASSATVYFTGGTSDSLHYRTAE